MKRVATVATVTTTAAKTSEISSYCRSCENTVVVVTMTKVVVTVKQALTQTCHRDGELCGRRSTLHLRLLPGHLQCCWCRRCLGKLDIALRFFLKFEALTLPVKPT